MNCSKNYRPRRLSPGKGKGGTISDDSDDGSDDVADFFDAAPSTIAGKGSGKGSGKGQSIEEVDTIDIVDTITDEAVETNGDVEEDTFQVVGTWAGTGGKGKGPSYGKGSSGEGASSPNSGAIFTPRIQGDTTDESNDDKDTEEDPCAEAEEDDDFDDEDFGDLDVFDTEDTILGEAGNILRYTSVSNDDPE